MLRLYRVTLDGALVTDAGDDVVSPRQIISGNLRKLTALAASGEVLVVGSIMGLNES